jgi:hypothetical protein
MSAFVYEQFLRKQYAGFAVDPASWVSINFALVNTAYTPNPATDAALSDIPGGALASDGMTGTVPTFTITLNGAGATPEAGIELAIVTDKWAAVPSGANVIAVVAYAILKTSPLDTVLIAYFDDWAGLPFTPNGTDVTLVSLPTPLQANGVNLVITEP